jgi:hypothetical protein
MTGGQLVDAEQERDDRVRTLPCPLCGVAKGFECDDGVTAIGRRKVLKSSHTARYLAAVEAGLVPPLRGWPWTG